jgi:hypothetical protein
LPILENTIQGVLVLAAYGDVLEDKERMKKCVKRALREGARRIVLDVSRVDVLHQLIPTGSWDPMRFWANDFLEATQLAKTWETRVACVIREFENAPSDLRKGFAEVVLGVKGVEVFGTREDAVNALKQSD